MNINRHNYETFFLLYVDNELSAPERKTVEQFIAENIDLKPELQLLLETTLPGETISFNTKNRLYKNEIDQDALQEKLLLHLDNELDPATAGKIEAAIASDSSVQHEWKMLQQVQLDPNENIIFENKSILYRHERDRVIAIRFWRVAAAAAILFACLFTGISLLKKNKAGDNEIVNRKEKPSTERQKQIKSNVDPGNNVSFDSLKTTVPENIASANDKDKNNTNNKTPLIVIKQKITADKNKIVFGDKLPANEKIISPKTSLENINNTKSNETAVSAVSDKNNEAVIKNKVPDEIANRSVKEKIIAPKTPVIDYNSIPALPDSYAKAAVLNESASGNDNKILYMNEENVTRSKIGGLFRKVKRIIERNTNIKTGNGVKIAGFEIAVK